MLTASFMAWNDGEMFENRNIGNVVNLMSDLKTCRDQVDGQCEKRKQCFWKNSER